MGVESRRTVELTSGAKQHEAESHRPPRIRQQWAAFHRARSTRLPVPGPEQWRPEHAEALREQRLRQAEAEAREARGTGRNVLTCWRQMPDLPEDASVLAGEWAFEGPVPRATHEVDDEVAFRKAVDAQVGRERRWGMWKRILFALLMFPCVFGGVGTSLQGPLGDGSVPGALLAYAGFTALCTVPWSRETRRLAARRFAEQWPEYWREALAAHTAHATWPERERERVAWTRRVLAGEHEAVLESVQRELEALELPFASRCEVHLDGAARAFLAVDLPEIDDVAPEVKQRMRWDGTMEETGHRTKVERHEDYLRLVAGLGLLLARTTFMAAPTMRHVSVAGFTPRRQGGSGALAPECVYEATFSREAAASWHPATVDSVRVLDAPANRFHLGPDKKLWRIDPPGWWAAPPDV
ncbi:hypothetical protein [Pyxidicoccus sp. MSG2]|uniref:hypothetical protein n=1 Tax=Pyxidicoccus sp. MSG2 TaxID=2996790 RepID=UPI00226EA49F|nr:hypothetical protein [Pyxidicoccus sp. MSG2]MCY1020267.1 hypothetical protein [Pyxidicoccus sp. MSG2]